MKVTPLCIDRPSEETAGEVTESETKSCPRYHFLFSPDRDRATTGSVRTRDTAMVGTLLTEQLKVCIYSFTYASKAPYTFTINIPRINSNGTMTL